MKAIIILGMHRSGTSALAGALCLSGVEAGEHLLPPVAGDNPKGYWEDAEIVACHNQLLAAIGSSWQDERQLPDGWWKSREVAPFRARLMNIVRKSYGEKPLWLLKDPRLCRLLPLWQEIFAELGVSPNYVICIRHPREVARSLAVREDVPEEISCMSWLSHVLEAERWSRECPRVVVTYENLLEDWRAIALHIARTFAIPESSLLWSNGSVVDDFLEPELRHHRDVEGASSELHEAIKLAIDAYVDIATGRLDGLESVRVRFSSLANVIEPWASHVQAMRVKANKKAQIQLFIDNGSGFSERESMVQPISVGDVSCEYSFELRGRSEIKALRLDPLEESAILSIHDAFLLSSDGRMHRLDVGWTNSSAVREGVFYFETSDPQIHFNVVDPTKFIGANEFRVRLRFHQTGRGAYRECINLFYADSKNRISALEGELIDARRVIEANTQVFEAQRDEYAMALHAARVREDGLSETHERALRALLEDQANARLQAAEAERRREAAYMQLVDGLRAEHAQALCEAREREVEVRREYEKSITRLGGEFDSARSQMETSVERLAADYERMVAILREEHRAALSAGLHREEGVRREHLEAVERLRADHVSRLQGYSQKLEELENSLAQIRSRTGYGLHSWINSSKNGRAPH